ncbi:acyl-CoA dehydrogenase [Bacillus sp. B15-48]|uniref:acyl-CoA dehydrogenase family protein n=1 Tax=Bacillus sp. B15-48 TaxID=1548601 RepID=UPI00193FA85E|nr:acyl-CoA dehydrogenase [Bacillus sp. B15-48]MBM4763316.1 hypothetical protein [Bacillus sp. B15-48]
MNFDYSDDEKLLQDTVNKLFKSKFPITEVRKFVEGEKIPSTLIKLLANQGLLGTTTWDRRKNKMEGVIYSVIIAYEAGRALLPFPLLENHVASFILNKYQKGIIADSLISGEEVATVAWEKSSIKMKRDADCFIVTGEFTGVPFANDCDYMLARVSLDSNQECIAIFNINSPNISKVKRDSMDQTYPLYNVQLNGYRLTRNQLIGSENDGSEIYEEMKMFARLLLCAEMVGGSEEILGITVNYANERKQFGQAISKFQAIKHLAAEMYLLLESSKSTLDYATWAVDTNNEERERVIPLLKSYVSDASNKITGTSIQIHGGIGFTWESDVHLYFKRSRRSAILLGDSYYHNEQIAKYMEKEFLLNPLKI